jgi:hypothetical protein
VDRPFDPGDPSGSPPPGTPAVAEVERQALGRLGGEYDRLAARLSEAGVDPARVIVVEYFDPLHDGDALCDTGIGVGPKRVDADEAAWAERNVLEPLNREVHAAAARHGWKVVGGVAEAYRRHGICAGSRRWIRTPPESLGLEFALSGGVHPNSDGHRATAALIAPALATTLAVDPGTTELAGARHEGYVRWWAIPIALLIGALGGALLAWRALR